MKFLIVEDHPIVREWLKTALLHSFERAEVAEAESAREAISLLPRKRWDAILLDINLPDRSGTDLLRDLRSIAPDAPVLVFTGKAEDTVGRLVMKAGASGFLPKTSSVDEIKGAIKRILAGKKYVTADLAVSLVDSVVKHEGAAPHHVLSARELEVLRLLGSGHTPTDIGERLGISVKTVSTYRTRILEKLELENTAELIRYAVTRNLVD